MLICFDGSLILFYVSFVGALLLARFFVCDVYYEYFFCLGFIEKKLISLCVSWVPLGIDLPRFIFAQVLHAFHRPTIFFLLFGQSLGNSWGKKFVQFFGENPGNSRSLSAG